MNSQMALGGYGGTPTSQWLPPGAGSTLLRAVEYFGNSRAGEPWAVLAAWAGGGLALVALSAARQHRAAGKPVPATVPPDSPKTTNRSAQANLPLNTDI